MKNEISGIILLGGGGIRLRPLTNLVNKHLLPIYNKTMAQHAAEFLVRSGITDLIFSVNVRDLSIFQKVMTRDLLGANSVRFITQSGILGTADAIQGCKSMIETDYIATLWGDNLFEYAQPRSCRNFIQSTLGCCIHTTIVDDPQHFGVVEIKDGEVVDIRDKPEHPVSNVICTGFMMHKSALLFSHIDMVVPNKKGERDIMDAVRIFLANRNLITIPITGWWMDAGVSFDSLLEAALRVRYHGINKEV